MKRRKSDLLEHLDDVVADLRGPSRVLNAFDGNDAAEGTELNRETCPNGQSRVIARTALTGLVLGRSRRHLEWLMSGE